MEVPLIEQIKIQAQMPVPLIKSLRNDLGKEKADALVRKALGNVWRDIGRQWWQQLGNAPLEKMDNAWTAFAAGDALEYAVAERNGTAYEVNVRRCAYARFFEELGEPDLGFLLVCSADFPLIEGFGDDVKLERSQTLMQGASYCDFRYRFGTKESE